MEKHAKVLKWILAIGIVVVLNLFFNYAVSLVYKEPLWGDFCKMEQVNIAPEDQKSCADAGGRWNEGGAEARLVMVGEKFSSGYCDTQFTCRQNHEDATKVYNRNVFVVLVVLGVASLTAGFFVSVGSVSLGLSLGGVLSFVIGAIRYWSQMDDYLRVIILGLALATLIWLGVKKLKQ